MNLPKDYRPSNYAFPTLPNLLKAEAVLAPVLGDHIYVGGACVGFYVDDLGAAEIRPTEDVDVILEIATEIERVQLDEKLRRSGLKHDMEGPICRWLLDNLKIDVMPVDEGILGFSNRWYPAVVETAIELQLDGFTIRIPNVCAFLATKIEAFSNRGNNEPIISSDFEDIVRVLDGCSFLPIEASESQREVKTFVADTFAAWKNSRRFDDALAAHLLGGAQGERAEYVNKQIDQLIQLGQI